MSSTVPKVSLQQIVDVLERAVNEIILGYRMIKTSSDEKGKPRLPLTSSAWLLLLSCTVR